MRWIASLVLGACASAAAPVDRPALVSVAGRSVSCGGIRIALPATSRVVRTTRTELIAASDDVALAVVFDGRFADVTTPFGNPRVDEQDSDGFNPVYRMAWRHENGCELRAIALMPLSMEGMAMLMAVAHTSEPALYIGSPRVAKERALTILLRQVSNDS